MNIKISTLTPLVIGGDSSNSLSPYSDYVWDRGQFYYVSPKKLENFLTRELTDVWVDKMKQSINNTQIEYSLKEFLEEHKIPLSEITIRKVQLAENPKRKTIKRFVTTAGRPFIPGSSLKGVFRTAVLYSWLKDTAAGKQQLQEISAKVNQFKKCSDRKEQNDIKKQISGDALMRKIFGIPQQDRFKNIQVGDSETMDAAALFIASVCRFNVKTQKTDAPLWTEALPAALETSCRLKLQTLKSNDAFWQLLGRWNDLCTLLNIFSSASLNREIEQLPENDFSLIIQHYKHLIKSIQQLAPGQAIIRLGQGKTIFDNTFLMLMESDPAFFPLREMWELGKSPKSKKISSGKFPVTRSFIAQNRKPVDTLGWVLIEGETA